MSSNCVWNPIHAPIVGVWTSDMVRFTGIPDQHTTPLAPVPNNERVYVYIYLMKPIKINPLIWYARAAIIKAWGYVLRS